MKCNLCEDGEMTYHEVHGTHIWDCPCCTNVQLEFASARDISNLDYYLFEFEKDGGIIE